MKASTISTYFILLSSSILLSGCYTQFQTFDRFPVSDRYSDYYIWNDFEERNKQSREQAEAEEYIETIHELEEADIYFKDYEAEQWYKENLAHRIYWKGYDEGYESGYFNGYEDALSYLYFNSNPWAYSSWYSPYHPFYNRGYFAASFYFNPFYSAPMYVWSYNFQRYFYYPFFNSYYYDYYAGYWGYGPSIYVYNDYRRDSYYSRNAELYKKGPRNSGLTNSRTRSAYDNRSRSGYRTRGSSGYSSKSSGARVRSGSERSKGSSVGRTRSTGRTESGSSVGRSRGSSGSSKGRSTGRSSGGSVGKQRSSGSSSGSSTGRSRSRGNESLTDSYSYDMPRVHVSGSNNGLLRTYTIPATKVEMPSVQRVKTRNATSAWKRFFNTATDITLSAIKDHNNSSRSSGVNRSSGSRSSHKPAVKSSSSRSGTAAKATNRSSSSSKSRSRGN